MKKRLHIVVKSKFLFKNSIFNELRKQLKNIFFFRFLAQKFKQTEIDLIVQN